MSLLILFFTVVHTLNTVRTEDGTEDTTIQIPNSCIGLGDGNHVLKLIDDDDFPLVNAACSNEYMIINIEEESNFNGYFSSSSMFHYAIMGPDNDDHVNWDSWWLPNAYATDTTSDTATDTETTNTKYIFSPNCDTCDTSSLTGHFANSNDVPYMGGNFYGCFWPIRGLHDYDMDWDTYECYYRSQEHAVSANEIDRNLVVDQDSTDVNSMYFTGLCATIPQSSDFEVPTDHKDCAELDSLNWYKPSLGTNGNNCVCYQPSSKLQEMYSVDEEIYNAKIIDIEVQDAKLEDNDEKEDVIYLYQSDFKSGTYRIQNSGTYVIMEDIIFDFNGDSLEDPWLPQLDQSDKYTGAGGYRDAYFLGFFSGITIETDNVILDLNGKKLSQSIEFYYQQRWFSLIELSSQPFMPGQGPGMFGAFPQCATNVEILNGNLGLSSHHGIHGNRNKNVYIHDIIVTNFETHGIQLNGFTNVKLENIEIYDSSRIAYLKGEYGHGRFILPRVKTLAESDEYDYETINNGDGDGDDLDWEIDLDSMYDDLKEQLNMAFDYVIEFNKNKENINKLFSNDISDWNDREKYSIWEKAKLNFLYDDSDDLSLDAVNSNSNGLSYGTAVYGIHLSFPGANVFAIGRSNLKSNTITINNVKIHGIRHKMTEYLRSGLFVNPFNAMIDMNTFLDDPSDISNAKYKGNILTDIYVAMDYISNNWNLLQMLSMSKGEMSEFALGFGRTSLNTEKFKACCNGDVMSHSGKGIMGIRLDGIEDFTISNVEIYDMYDYTHPGSDICGEYDGSSGSSRGHFLQSLPTQKGFSGNMMHGIHVVQSTGKIKNVNIHDIGSANGMANGIGIYKKSEVEFDGDIIISNIMAGFQQVLGTYTSESLPNDAPQACGIQVYWEYDLWSCNVTMSNDTEENQSIKNQCIRGHVGCFDNDYFGATMLGTYESCDYNSDSDSNSGKSILTEYQTDSDVKLLAIKDESDTLYDFEAKPDFMTCEESRSLYSQYVYPADGDDSMNNNKHGDNLAVNLGLDQKKWIVDDGVFYTIFACLGLLCFFVIKKISDRNIQRKHSIIDNNNCNYGSVNV